MPTASELDQLTLPGMAIGTITYMSPEQVRGEELDARTDLFSLGAVLYEMATGRQAFSGSTIGVIADRILNRVPAAIGRANPEIPPELERIINKALEKDRKVRYQNASDLRADLTRLRRQLELGQGATAAVRAGSAKPQRAGKAIDSIAVLPFANLSSDKENEYFCDGLAEEIINSLTGLPGLRVAARTSAFQFRGAQDLQKIADQLKVRTILEGSVARSGNLVRVMVRLVESADGHPPVV